MASLVKSWPRIAIWGVALGVLTTLIADWGEWDRVLVNLLWRVLIVVIGGLVGLALNFFASGYVAMGTNVIESMGVVCASARIEMRKSLMLLSSQALCWGRL